MKSRILELQTQVTSLREEHTHTENLLLTLSQHHTAIYWFQFALFALLGVGATICTWYVLSKLEALIKIVKRLKTLHEPEIIVIEPDPYDSSEDENDYSPSYTPEAREGQNSAHILNGPTSILAPIFISLVCLLTFPTESTCRVQPRIRSISDGVFSPIPHTLPKGWEYSPTPGANDWQHISFDQLWEQPSDTTWKAPIVGWSDLFGFAVSESQTFTQKYYPASRYWHDLIELERTCLCTRREAEITPPLSYDLLQGYSVISRPTGTKNRLLWKWDARFTPNSIDNSSILGLDSDQFPIFFSIWKIKVLSLLDQFAMVSSNCTRTRLDTGTLPEWKPFPWRAPLVKNNTVSQEFFKYHFCNDAHGKKYSWVGVCDKQCPHPPQTWTCERLCEPDTSNIDHMKCCDVTKSWNRDVVSYFGPIASQHAYFSEPADECCPDREDLNSNACIFMDSHTTWELFQFSCSIQGVEVAFEPTRTDIVIQEEIPSWMNYNPYSRFSTAFPLPPYPWPDRIKIVRPRYQEHSTQYYDGPVKYTNLANFYMTYPSMMSADPACQQRISKNPECNHPVGGLEAKLAFYNHVIFDPAQNRSTFPGGPVQLLGSSNTLSPTQPYQHRTKRQLTIGVVLFSLAVSAITSAISGATTGVALEEKFDAKLSNLQHEINQHFLKDEENIRALADKINAIDAANHVQDQAIARSLDALIRAQALQEKTDTYLQNEISQNQKILLKTLDLYLRTTSTEKSISLAELELDKLIIHHCQNLTGKAMFEPTDAFLTRIVQGNMYLQKYAHEAKTLINQSREQNNNTELPPLLKAINQTLVNANRSVIAIRIYNQKHHVQINVSAPRWHPKPLDLNFTLDGLSPQEFADAVTKGIETVPHTVAKLAEDGFDGIIHVVQHGASTLLKPILIPILLVTAALIIVGVVGRRVRRGHGLCPTFRDTESEKDLTDLKLRYVRYLQAKKHTKSNTADPNTKNYALKKNNNATNIKR